jgi:hypothetical protein
MQHQCDVCAILDGDTSIKEVNYCRLCDKHMCARCQNSPWRRAHAMFLYKFKPKQVSANG